MTLIPIEDDPNAWIMPDIDPRVSQWNKERDAKTNAQYIEARAYPPKVKIRDDVIPRQHEVYNCTSCRRGRELPANKMSQEDYHFFCRWDLKTHIGMMVGDNGCQYWDRKIKIPHKGYLEGVER